MNIYLLTSLIVWLLLACGFGLGWICACIMIRNVVQENVTTSIRR